MADAQAPQPSLWLQLLWKPVFRSRRERVANAIYAGAMAAVVILPTVIFEWFDSPPLQFLWIVLAISGLHMVGWAVWLFWGRDRFPLPAPDEPQSAA